MSQTADERSPSVYPAYPEPGQGPAPERPPLTKRMRLVHWIAIDCAVAGFLSLLCAATIGKHISVGEGKLPLIVAFMVVVFIPAALRRRAPVTMFGALLILGVLLSGLAPAVPAMIFLSAAFVLYTVTVESRRRTGATALGLILAVMVFLVGTGTHGRPQQNTAGLLVPVALANVIAWMTGYSVRQRRLYVVRLQQQAANSAVAEERLRIARELHDVVAHSMSVIAVQAGYGQYVIDTSPGGAREALGAIQATSRDALEEMRRMLGVLRQRDTTSGPAGGGPADIAPALGLAQACGQPPDAGSAAAGQATARQGQAREAPLGPAPGLAFLDRLIERTRGAGLRVSLEVTGHPRPAPAGVDLSAYRIIQEALTNVVRHAGTGASCTVSLCYTDADLVVRVTDDGGLPVVLPSVSVAAMGSGHGIIGMRERVHLCGGSFDAGPLPDGGFQVMAALPLPVTGPPAPGGSAGAPRVTRIRADTSPAGGLPAVAAGLAVNDGDGDTVMTSAVGNRTGGNGDTENRGGRG